MVGGGSAGAVIASRLSEDPTCRVALLEAGDRPPEVSSLPIACAAMQLNPEVDWMYTADPGKAGLGLNGGRIPVPRGKMLGGSSSINYMMFPRQRRLFKAAIQAGIRPPRHRRFRRNFVRFSPGFQVYGRG